MSRRDELLRKCRRYFLAHGVANVSLRPLAEAVGTSARMLAYHFDSKDGLIAAVMDDVRAELQASFAAGAAAAPPAHPLRAFWQALTRRENLPTLRLLFEVQILALQNPGRYGRYLADTSGSWLSVIEGALPAAQRQSALPTLYAAVVDGLLIEYLSTGDLRRTTAALERFLELVAGQQHKRGPTTTSGRRPRRAAARRGR
ncbi:MAG TPA: TetR/AcrR family transcriptional regulator [Thermoanaerobaculia bacterium]|jgi:AcrR family transcriptional regulator|nr:TetR/AcrR family transcriptional regulator [Thermoanaerobaculia bacterium]